MGNYQNEIDHFIYKICYRPIWTAMSNYIAQHLSLLDLTYSRIKYPDTAFIEDMLLEFTRNIQVNEDTLKFDAILSCTVNITETSYEGDKSGEISQWLTASCEATITDHLESLTVTSVHRYIPSRKPISPSQNFSANIVPILYKKDLESEAAAFLEKYCPKALETPMPVPITDIAKEMGLEIIEGNRISDDFSVFGEVYFTSGEAEVFDLFKISKRTIRVRRGTILIDAFTFWERNLGCVKNTIAHEVFHWYKHRMYAAIKHILYGEAFVACRCPSSMIYPEKDEEWSDVQRMEWQANNMAPRILMPLKPFQAKVRELYDLYGYDTTPLKLAVLTCVSNDLASFYGVSRQSALIRMMETGFKEAASIYNYNDGSPYHSYIDTNEAFYVYKSNREFRKLIDSDLFKYVDGYYVINDAQFLETDEEGRYSLSDYAWAHLEECTLQFTWQSLNQAEIHRHFPFELFHRVNADKKVSKYDSSKNASVIKLSEDIKKKREEFERQNAARKLTSTNKTCWELIFDILQSRGISKIHFCNLTGLGEEVYRKAEKNIDTRPSLRTIISIGRGLDLDIATTEKLMQLAGHAFDESDEHQALRFCITGFSGQSIDKANAFLESYNYEPLGSKQRR